MDISLPIGMGWGFTVILLTILLARGDLLLFVDPPSMMCTFGGTLASLLVAFKIPKIMMFPKLIRLCAFPPKYNPTELIITMVSFSEKARREGLLSLEDDIEQLDDEFMRKGLQLIVDGTDPEIVKTVLEQETDQLAARHDDNKRMFDEAAGYSPAFGMIGTLIGLVLMLVNLSDRSTIGPYLAVAIITTLYGAIIAYLIFIPVGTRLDMMTGAEVTYRTIILEGILSIQSGDNPRIVKEKLVAFLSPIERLVLSDDNEK
jgi:chemotaxis protein MotA